MSHLVFLLEEPSARELLQGLLPRLLSADTSVRYIIFEGKQDMEKQMVRRLRGYRKPHSRFVILRDRDSSDCQRVKADLVKKCRVAGRSNALVRIVCPELESWYLADLLAVERALGLRNLSALQEKAKYRDPDALANANQELKRLTGYQYQKISGSRAIGPHLDLNNTRSKSFAIFVTGLKRLISDMNR